MKHAFIVAIKAAVLFAVAAILFFNLQLESTGVKVATKVAKADDPKCQWRHILCSDGSIMFACQTNGTSGPCSCGDVLNPCID